jgi:hypothetical protein
MESFPAHDLLKAPEARSCFEGVLKLGEPLSGGEQVARTTLPSGFDFLISFCSNATQHKIRRSHSGAFSEGVMVVSFAGECPSIVVSEVFFRRSSQGTKASSPWTRTRSLLPTSCSKNLDAALAILAEELDPFFIASKEFKAANRCNETVNHLKVVNSSYKHLRGVQR